MSANLINADLVTADLDAINARILELLKQAQALQADTDAALIEEARGGIDRGGAAGRGPPTPAARRAGQRRRGWRRRRGRSGQPE